MLSFLKQTLANFLFRKSQRPFIYVAIGDSSAEGVGATSLDKSYPALVFENLKLKHRNVEYHNLAHSGDRIKHVVHQQLPKLLEIKPDLVTLSVGVNDIRGRVNVKNFEKDLNYLIETIQRETGAKIVINNIPDFSLLPTFPLYLRLIAKLYIRKFNVCITNITHNRNLILVDIFKESKKFCKDWRNYICDDGFHPSDSGYAIWANKIILSLH